MSLGMYNVSDIINVFKNNMVKSDKSITYYRVGGNKTTWIIKNTFIIVTDHIEDAISFYMILVVYIIWYDSW